MLISIENMYKTYDMGETEVNALNGVSFEIGSGEFVAIMGASGSGKSTLLNILGCLDSPTAGGYRLDGVEVSGMKRKALARVRNRKMGFVFQSFNLLSRTTALENVELPALYGPGFTAGGRRRRAREVLERVGLEDRLQHTPAQLSGGQQQRVAIARALMRNPPVILADEPTGNLDTRSSEEIMKLFAELHGEGITIVMVTHEEEVARYAGRRIVMRDGEIV